MRTILVTGGAGFIGSCLVRQLVKEPEYHVVNFDKLTYAGNLDSLQSVESASNYEFVQGDITDRAARKSFERLLTTVDCQSGCRISC